MIYITIEDRKYKIYHRKEDFHCKHNPGNSGFFLPMMTEAGYTSQLSQKKTILNKLPIRELTEQVMLQYIASTALLINSKGDILYIHGRSGLYLEPAPGETGTNNILKMAREGLKRELTIALHKVTSGLEIVRHTGLRVKTNGDFSNVNLTIMSIKPSPEQVKSLNITTTPPINLYLVILKESPFFNETQQMTVLQSEKDINSGVSLKINNVTDDDVRITALKQELLSKEEYLQSSNEELETTNEELKSSNEEMQSVNEELQSTNEELETSKEELQSVNEELATVNTELQTKVTDLSRINNDMNNLLAGSGIGTVFVDLQLRIIRFTPAATSIINLIQNDLGRPVGHIVSNLQVYNSLVADVQLVIDTLIPKEIEVQTQIGLWYTMRIQPYRTLENVIEGIVITFVNINKIKKAEEAMQKNENLFNILFENHVNPAAVYEIIPGKQGKPRDYILQKANHAFQKHSGLLLPVILDKRVTQIYSIAENTELIHFLEKAESPGESASFKGLLGQSQKQYNILVQMINKERFIVIYQIKDE